MNKFYLKNTLALLSLSSSVALFSQQNVSINLSGALSPNPAILDLSDASNAHLGFLMTNVSLTSITDVVTIPGPTVGMIVWNTNAALPLGVGYYYWSGTQWYFLYNSGTALGTVTSIAPGVSGANSGGGLTFAPNPIVGAGTIAIANTTVTAGSYGSATQVPTFTVNAQGQLTAAANVTIAGGGGTITGSGTVDYLARWTPTATNLGIGVTQDNGTTTGINVAPIATQMLTVSEPTAADIAIVGQNTAGNGTNNGTGVEGISSQGYNTGSGNNGYGVEALNNNANSGTGLYAAGNGLGIYNFLLAGSGSSANGTDIGFFATNSTFVAATGGAPFLGQNVPEGGDQVYVGNWFGGIFYKTIATGPSTNSCAIPDVSGNYVCMHAPETPEAYFEDYGQGQLVNGKVHIDMDPTFAKNICVNDKHPLRVFVQLYGDCKGVYIANTSSTGFDVVELNRGTSNVPFQYHVIGNMADEKMRNGSIAKFSGLRFEPAPKIMPTKVFPAGTQTILSK